MTKIEPQPPQPPRKRYSLHQSGYAIDYVEAADAQELLSIDSNFSDGDLFEADLFVSGNSGEATDWTTQKMRNGQEFQDHVKRLQVYSSTVMTPKTAVFFVYLSPAIRFGNSKLSIDTPSTKQLLSFLKMSPAAVANVFGRPDYWSPGHFVDSAITEFWCQHPRWDIHNREQPVSVYMTYNSEEDSPTYLISGSKDDYTIVRLQAILRSGIQASSGSPGISPVVFLDPFEIHYLVARLSFEFSKGFVSRLRRELYSQLDNIDQHTQSLNTAGKRQELKKLTTDLSVLSQNVDSFIAAFHMALGIASNLEHAHEELFNSAVAKDPNDAHSRNSQKLLYSIRWLSSSFESQMCWLRSYKARKDTSMNLVYNLVTQQDSAIFIQDSSTMKGIAILTMVFLPGAFTSSLLGCSILTASSHSKVDTTGLWWFWIALTIPLTIAVLGVFLVWYHVKQSGWGWRGLFRLGRSMNNQSNIERGLDKKLA